MSVQKDRYYDNYFVVYYDENGKRRQKGFKKDYDKAVQFDAEMKARNALRKLGGNPEPTAVGITLEQAVEAYLEDLTARGKSEQSVKDLRCACNRHFYSYFGRETMLASITYAGPKGITSFINQLRQEKIPCRRNRPYTRGSINRFCELFRAICNFAVRNEFITKSPMAQWRATKEQPRKFQASIADIMNVYAASSLHVQRAIKLAWNTGVRTGYSELLDLKWSDVDWNQKQLRVFAKKTEKERFVPLTQDFLDELAIWKSEAQTDHIIEYRGRVIRNIHRAFRRAVERSGVTCDIRLYDFRHMFATFMLNNGADLAAVSSLLGHSSITMTADVYYQAMKEAKTQAVNLMPKFPVKGVAI